MFWSHYTIKLTCYLALEVSWKVPLFWKVQSRLKFGPLAWPIISSYWADFVVPSILYIFQFLQNFVSAKTLKAGALTAQNPSSKL
ncbi:hypothetical protein ACFX12_032851 [Malus domestica]